jgi:hypothetical protein
MASTRHVFTIDRDIGIPGSSFAMGFVFGDYHMIFGACKFNRISPKWGRPSIAN